MERDPAPPNPRDATLERAARRAIRDHDLLPGSGPLVVGVSGGADSMALLHFLRGELAAAGHPADALLACHVHHGIRGEEADGDAAFVAETCAARGIPFALERVDAPGRARARHESLEAAARALRYESFRAVVARSGADRVAVAHTRDDQAETILFRFARGSGLRGLSGMAPVARVHRLTVVRPFLDVSREQVLAYVARHRVVYREDASNASTAASRNAIRHEILPRLRERLNPSIRETLLREAALFREVNEFLEAEGRRAFEICREEAPEGKIVLDRGRLLTYPKLLRSYVFRFAVQELNGALRDFSSTHVAALHSLVTQKSGRSIHLPLGLSARRERTRIVLAAGSGNRGRAKRHPTLETSTLPADR
ncbi:MAG: tRNA lysidine(34) synthetase TilS [Hyphomicrobiales bacterium]